MFALLVGGCLLLSAGTKEARSAWKRGLKAERAGDYAAALEAYTDASREDPQNIQYLTRREVARQRAAFRRVTEGLRMMERARYPDAAREFAAALELDPSNEFARRQKEEAVGRAFVPVPDLPARSTDSEPCKGGDGQPEPAQGAGRPPASALRWFGQCPSYVMALRPRPLKRAWDLRGDTRALYLALGAAYGIRFEFDEELGQRQVRLRLPEADFGEALRVLGQIVNTFVAPLDEQTAIVAPGTPAKRQQYERQVLKILDVSQLATPESLNEVANILRAVLEMRFVAVSVPQKVITVRDTPAKVMAAEEVVRTLARERPEVLVELQIVEVNRQRARELGLLPPQQTALTKLSNKGPAQSGNAVPLSQIFGRASPDAGGALSQGLATFGGGKTFFGLTIPASNFRATLSGSLLRSLTSLQLRGTENLPASVLIGSRFPIINASFSAIFLTGQALNLQQSGQLINPFPSFTFEDLGVKLKMTPRVHGDREVTLALEMQTRSLAGDSFNGVPGIATREFQGQVRLGDGQTAIITGLLTREERRSLAGLPAVGGLAGLGSLFSQVNSGRDGSEVLMLLTPHLLRLSPERLSSETIPFPTDYVPVMR